MTNDKMVLVLEDTTYAVEVIEDLLQEGETAGVLKSLQRALPESPRYVCYDNIMDSMMAQRVTLVLKEDFKPVMAKMANKYATVK